MAKQVPKPSASMAAVDKSTKEDVLIGIFIAVIAGLILQVLGTLYFASHPDAMNEPIFDAVYQVPILVGLVILGAVSGLSLAYERKTYVGVRVFTTIAPLVMAVMGYIWWFQVLDWLYA